MAEPSTVARPYAEAAFKLADAAGALGKWSEMLAALAQVAQDARVRAAVADPNLSDAQVAGLFIAILAGELIGGVKVGLGDKVIDGSARAQLGALETALKA